MTNKQVASGSAQWSAPKWSALIAVNALVAAVVGAMDSHSFFRAAAIIPCLIAGVAQLASAALIGAGVFGGSRLLGYSAKPQAVQGMSWLSLAVVGTQWPSRDWIGWALLVVPIAAIIVASRYDRQSRHQLLNAKPRGMDSKEASAAP